MIFTIKKRTLSYKRGCCSANESFVMMPTLKVVVYLSQHRPFFTTKILSIWTQGRATSCVVLINEMEGVGVESEKKGVKRSCNNVERVCELGLRASALALTLGAAIVMGVDKQTEVVPIQLSAGIPPFNVPVIAKWQYLSAFM